MAFNWDPTYVTHFVLTTITSIIGYVGYKKSQNKIPLYMGVAFGIFGVANFLVLLGIKTIPQTVFITARIIGYLIIMFALHQYWEHKERK